MLNLVVISIVVVLSLIICVLKYKENKAAAKFAADREAAIHAEEDRQWRMRAEALEIRRKEEDIDKKNTNKLAKENAKVI